MEVIDIKSEEVICYINHSSDTSDSEIHHAMFVRPRRVVQNDIG